MSSKPTLKVVSRRQQEFSSTVVIDKTTYHIQTEDLGKKTRRLATRIYHNGEIVYSRDSDYSHIIALPDFGERLRTMMENQHKSTAEFFVKEQAAKQKQKSRYFEEVQGLLKKGNGKSALELLEEALEHFPGDPFLMSYHGCLLAIVKNKASEGVAICQDAIRRLDQTIPFGSEFFYPTFYLNLARAYLKAGRKRDAVNALYKGLRNDPDNSDIHQELVKLGTRRKLPVPFLRRSNPVNKYIGMLLSKGPK